MASLTKTRHCPHCGRLIIKEFDGFGNFSFSMECAYCGEVIMIKSCTDFDIKQTKITATIN